jgi:hypothetical protein
MDARVVSTGGGRSVAAFGCGVMEVGDLSGANRSDTYDLRPGTQSFPVSDPIRLQRARLGKVMPPFGSADVVCDDGHVQMNWHAPPTPTIRCGPLGRGRHRE